jgi:monoamine oxidase
VAQQPLKDVYVVGDWISQNQGWVEGALESVQRIIASIRKQQF